MTEPPTLDDPRSGIAGWSRTRRLVTIAGLFVATGMAVWGLQVLRVLRTVDSTAEYWSVPRGEAGGLVYVALGDSAAQGVGASSPEAGYVSLLADRLRDETGLPVQVVNLSSSGARIRDVIADQLPRLAPMCADVVTVGVGGNDIRDYDADTFAREIAELTDALPPGTIMADLPYFMHGQWQADVEEGNALLVDDARSHGLVVADLQAGMRERGWGGMFTDYAADWFHPNDRGHRVWASVFWTAMEPRVSSLEPGC